MFEQFSLTSVFAFLSIDEKNIYLKRVETGDTEAPNAVIGDFHIK